MKMAVIKILFYSLGLLTHLLAVVFLHIRHNAFTLRAKFAVLIHPTQLSLTSSSPMKMQGTRSLALRCFRCVYLINK